MTTSAPENPKMDCGTSRLYARLRHRHQNGAFTLDAEFVLNAGITILFGPSGTGKTTLLNGLAGLVAPESGRIVLGETVLFDSEQRIDLPTRQRQLGYLFQSPALFPHLTARQNIEYGLDRLPREERDKRSTALLDAFKVTPLADRRPAEISGGEAQRVALARALATEPRMLLLDEPLGGLDAAIKSHIIADLRTWNRRREIPILFVTHDRFEVYALGERVLVLENGSIVADGSPHDVLEFPRTESLAQMAGFENVFDADVLSVHPEQGTMTCRLLPRVENPETVLETVFSEKADFVQIEAPLGHARPGARVRIAVRAGDILLATEPPRGLSARNVLPARISAIERRDAFMAIKTDCGSQRDAVRATVSFESHVTPGAVAALDLSLDKPVWLVIKTHSWRILG
jgi:molybdate transport system ATP-binding protein